MAVPGVPSMAQAQTEVSEPSGGAAVLAFSDLPDEVSVPKWRHASRLLPGVAAVLLPLPPPRFRFASPLTAPRSLPAHTHMAVHPWQVLALVASLGLTEARDVASFAATCKRCAAVVAGAPLRLGVRPSLGAAASPQEEQAVARASLHALCASWPGGQEERASLIAWSAGSQGFHRSLDVCTASQPGASVQSSCSPPSPALYSFPPPATCIPSRSCVCPCRHG